MKISHFFSKSPFRSFDVDPVIGTTGMDFLDDLRGASAVLLAGFLPDLAGGLTGQDGVRAIVVARCFV